MGDTHTAKVDVTALDAVAGRFDDAAALIERAAAGRLVFDGAAAGRAHTATGNDVRRRLDGVLADLTVWARAGAEIGVVLRTLGRRYRDAEQAAAGGMR